MNNVTLIGMPGSGKSTIGVILAKALRYEFLDVELEVVDMGKADDGFAADYEGVYQIMKINKMALK